MSELFRIRGTHVSGYSTQRCHYDQNEDNKEHYENKVFDQLRLFFEINEHHSAGIIERMPDPESKPALNTLTGIIRNLRATSGTNHGTPSMSVYDHTLRY